MHSDRGHDSLRDLLYSFAFVCLDSKIHMPCRALGNKKDILLLKSPKVEWRDGLVSGKKKLFPWTGQGC